MLTGSAAVSFHGSGPHRASYVRTEAAHRLFNEGPLKAYCSASARSRLSALC